VIISAVWSAACEIVRRCRRLAVPVRQDRRQLYW
jgi:hypothetical protein